MKCQKLPLFGPHLLHVHVIILLKVNEHIIRLVLVSFLSKSAEASLNGHGAVSNTEHVSTFHRCVVMRFWVIDWQVCLSRTSLLEMKDLLLKEDMSSTITSHSVKGIAYIIDFNCCNSSTS